MWHSIHCWNDSELHLISSLCEWESLCKHVTVCGALWFLPEFVSQVFKSSSDKLRCKKCSFIPSLSVLCRCNSVRLPNPPPHHKFKRNWTLKSLFASLLFTRVLAQEFLLKIFGNHWWKRLWGKKNNKLFLSHPQPICCGIIFFYYLQIMCADMISTVWCGGHCVCSCCVFFLFVCETLSHETGSSPMCI